MPKTEIILGIKRRKPSQTRRKTQVCGWSEYMCVQLCSRGRMSEPAPHLMMPILLVKGDMPLLTEHAHIIPSICVVTVLGVGSKLGCRGSSFVG